MKRDARDVIAPLLRTGLRERAVVTSDDDLWSRLQARPVQQIVTLNLFDLHGYVSDPAQRALVDRATAWTADGFPLVRALRRAGGTVSRVTGSGLCQQLLRRPGSDGLQRIAVLGSDAATVAAFGGRLRSAGRSLVHQDTGHRDVWTQAQHLQALRAARPDLVLVAVGAPHGLPTAYALAAALDDVPVMCVGAGVGMAAATDRRAPTLVQRVHGEWLWRLARDPARLWRRYVVDAAPLVLPLRRAADLVRARP